MTGASANWSFSENDSGAIGISLRRFLDDTQAMCALLVDRAGQLVTSVGSAPGLDATTFATLTAADFGANDQLARILGETEFTTLFHQGDRESVYAADVAKRLILVVIFDSRTSAGLVRLKLKAQVEELTALLDQALSHAREPAGLDGKLLQGAEEEIDKLFEW